MNEMIHQLVRDVVRETRAAPPPLLAEDAPVLEITDAFDASPYFVGVIGGKDVGKSSLINALVGKPISDISDHGEGTGGVIAYAHTRQAQAVRTFLESHSAGNYRIVEHDLPALGRQVLLDLPDIDSHYQKHVELTRRMLRGMLYPIWITSVEKYADRAAMDLLARVALGNAPENLLFCLNKADRITNREGLDAARELADDYARRLQRVLDLPQPPRVWLISAREPQEHDLPQLARLLADDKSGDAVRDDWQRAAQRQRQSLRVWLDGLRLRDHLAAAQRLEEDAAGRLQRRVGTVVEKGAAELLADPAYRFALGERAAAERLVRWPLVNAVGALLSPLWSLAARVRRAGESPADIRPLLEEKLGGMDVVAGAIVAVFSQLHAADPEVSHLYERQRLWEPAEARVAASGLMDALADRFVLQRDVVRARLRGWAWLNPLRWLLTIGPLLWFPFVQPLLREWMRPEGGQWPAALIQALGVDALLKSAVVLALYYAGLWMWLRWRATRQVHRVADRWLDGQWDSAHLSFAGAADQWLADLLAPLRQRSQRLARLLERGEQLL